MTDYTRFHIRSLAPADISGLQVLDRAAHGREWSTQIFLDDIELDGRIHLVLEDQQRVVGHAAAWLDGTSCRLTNVAVATSAAGQGYASALLVNVFRKAIASPTITNLQLEVRPNNRRAQRLYERFGFVPVGLESEFYDEGDALGNRDALVMAVTDVCSDAWRARLNELDAEISKEAAA